MRNLIFIIGIFTNIFLFISCNKEQIVYQDEDDNTSGIYFFSVVTTDILGNPTRYSDSLLYNFKDDAAAITERTVSIPVQTLGKVADVDRDFLVKVVGGTAKEGIDYEKLLDSYIIPAGTNSANIPVLLKRTPILAEKALTIDLQLVENKNFKLLLPYLNNISNNVQMDATKFRINFTEIITENSYYTSFATRYFGTWSVKKFKLLNELMGWKTEDWSMAGFAGYPVATGKFPYAAQLFKSYLENKLSENNPVYEDDGTPMQLGPSYLVDYSSLNL